MQNTCEEQKRDNAVGWHAGRICAIDAFLNQNYKKISSGMADKTYLRATVGREPSSCAIML